MDQNQRLSIELVQILLNGLIDSPNFIIELPGVLTGLETGKNVVLNDKISTESGRTSIEKLFDLFPLLIDEYQCDLKHLRKLIIKILMKFGYIKNPTQLHSHEIQVCKTPCLLLFELLNRFPDIKFELNDLLGSIVQQEKCSEKNEDHIIDLNGLGNSELSNMVGKLLLSLGLKSVGNANASRNSFTVQDSDDSDDDEAQQKYEFPTNRSDRKKVIKGIECFMNVLSSYTRKPKPCSSIGRKRSRSDSGNSSDSSSGDSDSNISVQSCIQTRAEVKPADPLMTTVSENHVQLNAIIGPCAPTPQELEQSKYNPVVYSDSDEDDDVGPQVAGRVYVEPLGGPVTTHAVKSEKDINSSQAENAGTQREEWMVVPGLKDPFGSAVVDPSAVLTNKGFQTGKLAKKAAEAVDARSEAMREAENAMNEEKNRQAQELLDLYRSQRGPSLMDVHLENRKSGKAKGHRSSSNSKFHSSSDRRSFDRDEVGERSSDKWFATHSLIFIVLPLVIL